VAKSWYHHQHLYFPTKVDKCVINIIKLFITISLIVTLCVACILVLGFIIGLLIVFRWTRCWNLVILLFVLSIICWFTCAIVRPSVCFLHGCVFYIRELFFNCVNPLSECASIERRKFFNFTSTSQIPSTTIAFAHRRIWPPYTAINFKLINCRQRNIPGQRFKNQLATPLLSSVF